MVATRNTSSTAQGQPSEPVANDGRTLSAPETLEEQLAAARKERDELLQQDELRRVKEEIAALQNRSAASASTERRDEETSESTRSDPSALKRRNPFDEDESLPRRKKGLKPKDPTLYSGASLKQYRDYIRDCELSYKNAPESFPTEEDLITWAMQFLTGDTKESWWAQYELMQDAGEELTWDFYKQYILDAQLDPVNRGIDAAIQFNKAAQREGQTTRAFATYLATLEDQLPKYSEAHRVQTLFSKLRVELQLAITNTGAVPATREALIVLATTKERNLRKAAATGATKMRGSHTSFSRSKENLSSRHRGDKDKSHEQRTSSAPRPLPTCYACGEVGHISPNCTKKPSSLRDKGKGNPNKAPVNFTARGSGKA
jgi:hypothetical protein